MSPEATPTFTCRPSSSSLHDQNKKLDYFFAVHEKKLVLTLKKTLFSGLSSSNLCVSLVLEFLKGILKGILSSSFTFLRMYLFY